MSRHETIAKIAAMAAARAAASKATKPRAKKADPAAPTPERMAKGDFVEEDIVDVTPRGRMTIGHTLRLRPRFEKIEGLGAAQLKALRQYRKAFDQSEVSEVKSGLDVGTGGGTAGSHAAISRMEARAFGGHELRAIERHIRAALLPVLRDVALHDLTFSEAAMKRYGSRDVDCIVNGVSVTKPAPRSGKHRDRIRAEFMTAVALLVEAVGPQR